MLWRSSDGVSWLTISFRLVLEGCTPLAIRSRQLICFPYYVLATKPTLSSVLLGRSLLDSLWLPLRFSLALAFHSSQRCVLSVNFFWCILLCFMGLTFVTWCLSAASLFLRFLSIVCLPPALDCQFQGGWDCLLTDSFMSLAQSKYRWLSTFYAHSNYISFKWCICEPLFRKYGIKWKSC